VTGAASGIGVETARALAGTGADVTLAVRDADAGARVAADVTATTGIRTFTSPGSRPGGSRPRLTAVRQPSRI
jgi:short-subunit dehydrogenase